MQTRALGTGMRASAVGLGCAPMSGSYGLADDASGIATIRTAIDRGISLIDTADHYGGGHNERLIGRALRPGERDKVVLSAKFGVFMGTGGVRIDTSPAVVADSLSRSLRRLGTDHVDIYRPSRLDPKVPIEDTVGAIGELVSQGFVRGIGLSEVGAETIRRAHAVHPITDVQIEYSLFSRGIEDDAKTGILATCRELGIGITAYGVLAQGMLSGRWTPSGSDSGSRSHLPRFSGSNLDANLALIERLRGVAISRGTTVARLAIAWVLAQGREHGDIVALVGASRPERVHETVSAADLQLTADDLVAIETAVPRNAAAGNRYTPALLAILDSER